MNDILRQFIRANYSIVKKNILNKKADEKTGISGAERIRVLKKEFIEDSSTTLFGNKFHYTSATAMLHSLDELFSEDIYKFKTDNSKPYIIDCGANMGLSIIYFKRMFPNAEIEAFEPDKKIFSCLEKNIAPYNSDNSIKIYEKGVWTTDTTLHFKSDGGLSGKITDENNDDGIITIKTTDLKKYLTRQVDFLKIDIEGAENEVIFDLKGHLSNVKNMFLEFHGIIDEPQNLGDILNLLKEEGFNYYIRLAGETMRYPFMGEKPRFFNQQLNIFCFRK